MNLETLKSQCRGRWQAVLMAAGIPAALLNGRNQPCPFCGGKDRFRFTDHEQAGLYYCNQCGPGDPVTLVSKMLDIPLPEAVKAIALVIGSVPRQPHNGNGDRRAERARAMLAGCVPIQRGDPVTRYLSRRGLSGAPASLMHHPRAFEPFSGRYVAGMVALVKDAAGDDAGLHITYLEKSGGEWGKANVRRQKQMRKFGRTLSGCAVQLRKPHEGKLAVAEGIETALAVHELLDMTCWAVLSTSGMTSFVVPKGISHVTVCADADENYAGQHAAYSLANRLVAREKLSSDVLVPDGRGMDWLDVLNSKRK